MLNLRGSQPRKCRVRLPAVGPSVEPPEAQDRWETAKPWLRLRRSRPCDTTLRRANPAPGNKTPERPGGLRFPGRVKSSLSRQFKIGIRRAGAPRAVGYTACSGDWMPSRRQSRLNPTCVSSSSSMCGVWHGSMNGTDASHATKRRSSGAVSRFRPT